jgi:hypothetical protein
LTLQNRLAHNRMTLFHNDMPALRHDTVLIASRPARMTHAVRAINAGKSKKQSLI